MQITNLGQNPERRAETLALIEESLGYENRYRFDIDFAPLVRLENASHCYIAIDQNKVVGHLGLKKRSWNLAYSTWEVGLLGGICTAKEMRGKGVFSSLFHHLLQVENKVALFWLWSDQIDFYTKFGFFLTFEQNSYQQTPYALPTSFKKELVANLTASQREEMKILYQEKILNRFSSLTRKEGDWNDINLITSTDLYLQKNRGIITNYFFINKGQDLQGVIHESTVHPEDPYFEEVQSFGQLWSPLKHSQIQSQEQFGGLVKVVDQNAFEKLILVATQGAISISCLDDQFCELNNEKISYQQLMCELWGPGKKSHWNKMIKPFYLSGLDSI